MYEIALTVSACLRAGTRVNVAWAVASDGLATRDKGEAVAFTAGGGRVGALLSGALDGQLADLANRDLTGRAMTLEVSPLEAELAGLPRGGAVRCLLVPGADLPAGLWDRLRERDPVCLVSHLDGDRVVDTALFDASTVAAAGGEAERLFTRGVSDTSVGPDTVVTALWPVPRLVIVGGGPMADALHGMADLLGWHTQVINQANVATGVIASLAALDKVVVMAHDVDLAGAALAAALSGQAGYIGALGARRMQQARADWLAYRGVTDLDRVHGPAGLDIGANSPGEIAVSVLAEAIAVMAGTGGGSLRERPGPVG